MREAASTRGAAVPNLPILSAPTDPSVTSGSGRAGVGSVDDWPQPRVAAVRSATTARERDRPKGQLLAKAMEQGYGITNADGARPVTQQATIG
jgi:hypothetical protein